MRNFIRATTLLSVLAFATSPVAAATQSEFYLSLLRRGVASYDASRYTDAAKQLRLAAFGLVDTVDQYQLAHMYLAMSLDKLGQKDRAADSARRVIAAERVSRKYATAPAAVRTAFEEAATKMLTPAELAMLRGGPIVPAAPSATPARSTTSAMTTATPPRTSAPVPVTQTPEKPPATQTQTPAQTTTTTKPQQTVSKPPATQPVVTPPQQSVRPENAAPQTTPPPAPAATKPKPEPAPAKPAVKPPATTPPSTTPTTSTPPRTAPATTPARPATTTPATTAPAPRALTANEIATRMASAERALSAANLTEARRAYRELLGAQGLDHDAMIRVAEGLYRARDFAGALTAFANLGTLRRGEEPYRYYIAVAAFETGDRARAKRELAAALPYIEITPDVARYRSRIESAQ